MSKVLHLDIVTPHGTIFSGAVVAVTLPGSKAPFQVLYNHAPILSSLEPGVVKVLLPDLTPRYYAIGGGFAEVLHNRVTVLVERVTPGEVIDPDIAAERLREARRQLAAARTRQEFQHARVLVHEASIAVRAAQLARQAGSSPAESEKVS